MGQGPMKLSALRDIFARRARYALRGRDRRVTDDERIPQGSLLNPEAGLIDIAAPVGAPLGVRAKATPWRRANVTG
jgi:hypothetical protein